MKKYSLLLLLFLIPYYAFAVKVAEHPNLDFTINADDATCSVGKANENITEAIIPSEVTINGTNYPVTSIRYAAFDLCDRLTSVEIPSSVIEIGMNAFEGCTQLKTLIFMGNACPSIADYAFFGFSGTVYVLNETLVESVKAKFPYNEVKPMLGFDTEVGTYIMTGDKIAVTYPEGYAPEELIYSVTEGNSTIVDNVITGHGAATVRVVDADNADIYAETTLNVYLSGDSNDNGTVAIDDAVNTANYIVGKESQTFLKIAANVVDPDVDRISVADVVATVDIVLVADTPGEEDIPSPVSRADGDRLTVTVGQNLVTLGLTGGDDMTALQADITLPAGAVLNGVIAGDRLTANHSVMYRMVDDRTVRVAVFSLSLDTFVPGDGAVVKAAVGGIMVEGARGMAVEVYGMDGRLVRSITTVDERITVYVAPGVYAVRIGNAPAVKIAVR